MLQSSISNTAQRIVVTGGAGFIGSALIRYLIEHTNAVVLNIDKLTYAVHSDSLKEAESSDRYSFLQIDICDAEKLNCVVKDFGPTAIIHLAAESHVDRSISGPSDFIQTNIVGTYNLLQAARLYLDELSTAACQDFRFLHVSTDEVYGDLAPNDDAFTESSPYAPSSPYAASKASSDHLVRAWARTYNLPTLITNCSNNYGIYQNQEKLIPHVIHCALDGEKLPIYGDGMQIRDWLHVSDHVDALYHVLKYGTCGETYNIGSNNEIANIELVNIICDLLEKEAAGSCYSIAGGSKGFRAQIKYVTDRAGHDNRYAINNSKLTNELNWTPKVTFEMGLRETVRWYVEQYMLNSSVNSARGES